MINFSTLKKCLWKYLNTQNEPKLQDVLTSSALVLNGGLGSFLEHENRQWDCVCLLVTRKHAEKSLITTIDAFFMNYYLLVKGAMPLKRKH